MSFSCNRLYVSMGKNQILESTSEKILGVQIDAKLKFDKHVDYLLKVAGRKLTGRKLTIIARMSIILSFSKLRLLIKSFFDSQFSYCPLVWMFCGRTRNNRINKLQERALRILYKDGQSIFQHLLNKDKSITIHARNIQLLATEMYKAKNGNSPCSLSEFVTPREISYNLRGGSDFLPYNPTTAQNMETGTRDIKESPSLSSFKSKIKYWTTNE